MSRHHAHWLVAALAVALTSAPAHAQDDDEQNPQASLPTIPLTEITDTVARKSGKTFLFNRHVDPDVVAGDVRPRDADYDTLLIILRNNDLAAVSNGDTVTIVPVQLVRQHALPVLFENDDTIADEEWVSRVVTLENAEAAHLVPIMRPLMPRAGHLAAHPGSNSLAIVDRYANVRRLTEMMMRMDAESEAQRAQH